MIPDRKRQRILETEKDALDRLSSVMSEYLRSSAQSSVHPMPTTFETVGATGDKDAVKSNDFMSWFGDPSELYAAPVMRDACRCPHLDAFLPTILQTKGSGLFARRYSNNKRSQSANNLILRSISDLHFTSLQSKSSHSCFGLTEVDGTESKADCFSNNTSNCNTNLAKSKRKTDHQNSGMEQSNVDLYEFRGEEYKFDAISSGGLSEYYCQLVPPLYTEAFETKQPCQQYNLSSVDFKRENPPTTSKGNSETQREQRNHMMSNDFPQPIFSMSNTQVLRQSPSTPYSSTTTSEPVPITNGHKLNNDWVSTQRAVSNTDNITDSIDGFRNGVDNEPFYLPIHRFRQLHEIKRNLLNERETLANLWVEGKKSSVKSNRKKEAITQNSQAADGYVLCREKNPITSRQSKYERYVVEANNKVEHWLDVLRENRIRFWSCHSRLGNNEERHRKFYSYQRGNCLGNSSSVSSFLECRWCTVPAQGVRENQKRDDSNPRESSCIWDRQMYGDSLMQCLECSAIGCGSFAMDPKTKFSPSTQQHIFQHFLLSRHSLGITCGPLGAVFCMNCGDFIYHDVFDAEKERLAIQFNTSWFGWMANGRLMRSFNFVNFVISPDSLLASLDSRKVCEKRDAIESDVPPDDDKIGSLKTEKLHHHPGLVLWRGFRATYPSTAAEPLIEAALMTYLRLQIFGGFTGVYPSLLPLTNYAKTNVSSVQCNLSAPVGLYNLGNTCYINSVLQCLLHCAPLQSYFLSGAWHNFLSCTHLRSQIYDGTKIYCMGCEFDKLILSIYGSAKGLDVRQVLESSIHSSLNAFASIPINSKRNKKVGNCNFGPDGGSSCHGEVGFPVVVAELLTAIKKCRDMPKLAGHEQHDAHEFLQEFLHLLGRHCSDYLSAVEKLRIEASNVLFKSSINEPFPSGNANRDVVKDVFGGELRSSLICGQCYHKRIQTEPYLNVSLPLPKDFNSDVSNATEKETDRGHLNLLSCLEHFISPEELSDHVYCEVCAEKTLTLKQHTFAKLPKILCFHLKRFDLSKNKKITDPVKFPTLLNMGLYLPGWCEVIQGNGTFSNTRTVCPDDYKDNSLSPVLLYDLFATIDHSGSLNQGHYVSNLRIEDKWYRCNDALVSMVDEKFVLENGHAYLLFYARRC